MNIVDRATLIDFALGRLEDAEAAALARRAEVDSEFAQTLDALRQEITSLDRVHFNALPASPCRALLAAGQSASTAKFGQDATALDVADYNENAESRFPADDAPFAVDNESTAEGCDAALLSPSSSNVVKIRRVGPAYPFYADESDAPSEEAESVALPMLEPPTPIDENCEIASTSPDGENNETASTSQESENAQISETQQCRQDAQINETTQNAQTSRRFKRFDFIPKFIAAASTSQSSPFVAKKARPLGDAPSLFLSDDEFADVAASSETSRPVGFDVQNVVEDFNGADATQIETVEATTVEETRAEIERQDENQQERIYRLDNQENVENFDDDALENVSNVDDDKATTAEETRAEIERQDENQQERIYRLDNQENVENFDDDALENISNVDDDKATTVEKTRAEIERQDENQQERIYRLDNQENVENFDDDNPAIRRLVELLGRKPTAAEREEYYWEEVNENDEISATIARDSLLKISARWATAPVVAVGRTTLAFCSSGRRAILGADAFAATKPRRRRQPGKASDTMISIVAGILIATFVVFPLMRLAVREIFTTIAKSAVRKIGENVAISENAPQSDLLPFISEQLVFPRYETAAPRAVGGETILETGTRSETPLSPVDVSPRPLDPASTPPTLEPPLPNLAPPTPEPSTPEPPLPNLAPPTL